MRLQTSSPCIDAGTNVHAVINADLDGRPRIGGVTVDMGAYELQAGVSGEFLGWLQKHALPVDGAADAIDTDADGLSNHQEWRVGTNPTDALSALTLLPPLKVGSDLLLRWPSVTNRTYFLERSASLGGQPEFLRLATGLNGGAEFSTYTDTNTLGSGFHFYRIGVE